MQELYVNQSRLLANRSYLEANTVSQQTLLWKIQTSRIIKFAPCQIQVMDSNGQKHIAVPLNCCSAYQQSQQSASPQSKVMLWLSTVKWIYCEMGWELISIALQRQRSEFRILLSAPFFLYELYSSCKKFNFRVTFSLVVIASKLNFGAKIGWCVFCITDSKK